VQETIDASKRLKNWWDRGLTQELEDNNEIQGAGESVSEVAEALVSLFVFYTVITAHNLFIFALDRPWNT
jgi:hypothetical protein